jgi:hypothetical protein
MLDINSEAASAAVAIAGAIKAFGEYSYDDKGPLEVMDVDIFAKRWRLVEPAVAVAILQEVVRVVPDGRGYRFASCILSAWDDGTDEWADAVFDTDFAQENY